MVAYHHLLLCEGNMAKETYNHSYRETVDEIAKCLDYKKENGFNTLITKRLKELRELYEKTLFTDPYEIQMNIYKNMLMPRLMIFQLNFLQGLFIFKNIA